VPSLRSWYQPRRHAGVLVSLVVRQQPKSTAPVQPGTPATGTEPVANDSWCNIVERLQSPNTRVPLGTGRVLTSRVSAEGTAIIRCSEEHHDDEIWRDQGQRMISTHETLVARWDLTGSRWLWYWRKWWGRRSERSKLTSLLRRGLPVFCSKCVPRHRSAKALTPHLNTSSVISGWSRHLSRSSPNRPGWDQTPLGLWISPRRGVSGQQPIASKRAAPGSHPSGGPQIHQVRVRRPRCSHSNPSRSQSGGPRHTSPS